VKALFMPRRPRQPVHVLGGMSRVALKHHVLEEVAKPERPGGSVLGPTAVPDLHG